MISIVFVRVGFSGRPDPLATTETEEEEEEGMEMGGTGGEAGLL